MRLFLVHIAARAIVPLIAAASVASSQTFLFDYYNVSNGLPSNWITSMCQDSRGYLWVGCDGGLAVYDGVSFKAIGTAEGLPVPLVWSVIEDRLTPGTMYAGTYLSGLSKLQNGKITNIALGNTDASNTIATLLQDRSGVIWCGTGKGVYRRREGNG